MPQVSLRDQLLLQNPTSVSADAQRTPSGSGYEDVATIRGEVRLDSAREQVRAGRHEPEQTGVVKTRARNDIGDASRLIWKNNGDRVLGVIGIRQTDPMGRWIEIDVHVNKQT
jgi:head-tail adaptor